MSTKLLTKESLPSKTNIEVEDALITDKKVVNDSKDDLPVDDFVDIHQRKVVDENFREAVKNLVGKNVTMPNDWNDMTVRDQRNWLFKEMKSRSPNLPEDLAYLTVGFAINGDCGRPSNSIPEWLDREKFRRGQRFAMDHYAGISLAEMLSLFTLFSFEHGLKPLIVTGKSSDPFTSFKRYLSTGKRIRGWLSTDVWTEGTEGYKDMQTVRRMHANIRRKLNDAGVVEIDKAAIIKDSWSCSKDTIRQDFQSACPAPAFGQCPYMYSHEDRLNRPAGLNQGEMAGTQFGFMGLIILYPEKFGIYNATDEDLDAYCHVWRGLGYLLGIEDEFNFCKGSLEEIKERCRGFIEYWVKTNLREVTPEWEHMMRCVMVGITYYFPTVTYEHTLLYLADMIGVPMPRFRASMSYATWIRFYILKFTFAVTARFPGAVASMNLVLNKCMDRGLALTNEELEVLRKRSQITLSKGIAETVAVNKEMEMTKSTVWQAASFFVFSIAFLFLNLPSTVKKYTSYLFHDNSGSASAS